MAKLVDEVTLHEKDYSEDIFSIVVLYRAKKLFGDNVTRIGLTRMVKLVTVVADDIDFDLTRGWYKFGEFSPNAYTIAKDGSDGDLMSFELPKELVEECLEELKEVIPLIDKSIKNWEPIFIKDQTSFYNWVYETKAPEEFKGLYKSHRDFNHFFSHLLIFFRFQKVSPKISIEKANNQNIIVRNFYKQLNYLNDDETLNIFCDFMDLFEMVMLRIRNKDYHVNEDDLIFLRELKRDYCDSENDLWTLLVPYSETLTGMGAEDAKKWYRNKCECIKDVLSKKIENFTEQAESMDLLPTIEEMEVEIEKYDSKEERLPLREICARV